MGVTTKDNLRRDSWWGFKPIAARTLCLPVINGAVRAIATATLPKSKLHRLPVSQKSAAYVLDSNEKITLLNPFADQVAKDLIWGAGKPTSKADANVLSFVEATAKSVDRFLDIGAYSGLFALIAARANPHLCSVAYEIMPENYLMIAANVIRNDMISRVQVKHLGLGDSVGTITMPIKTNTVAHPSSMSLAEKFEEGVQVPITTLDMEAYDCSLLIKIDVEGFEWNVIRGGARTIQKLRPDMICEFLQSAKDTDLVQALLEPLGYRFYISLEKGFERRTSITPSLGGRDWVLTTRDI